MTLTEHVIIFERINAWTPSNKKFEASDLIVSKNPVPLCSIPLQDTTAILNPKVLTNDIERNFIMALS